MTNILIIHYNTPQLTECLVKSINKFEKDTTIYIFDNSDKLPFTTKFDNVKLLDNTKGQYIDFDKWLEKYPNKGRSHGKVNNWGSAKHCYSVEKCMELIGDNFILLDSDVLLKRKISNLIKDDSVYVGEIITQPLSSIKRVLPFICFINVKLCKEKGIHYFDDNYMHGLSKSPGSDRYDTGAGFYLNSSKYKHLSIVCEEYVVHYGHGSWGGEGIKKKLTPLEWLNVNKKYWSNEKNKKVIYTCITGGYDSLIEPTFITGDFDYICFTDNNDLKSDAWIIKPLPSETEEFTNVKKQRYVKINPHLLLKEYDLSIWVDGNVEVKGDLNDLISKKIKNEDNICVPAHPQRKCIYDEERVVLAMKKDVKGNTSPQINRYKKEGFPKNYGLLQSNILIRRHNSPDCIKLMEDWFEEVKNGSHRDQLSFNYAAWKNKNIKITYLDKFIYKSQWFKWHGGHKKSKPIAKTNPIINRRKIIKNEETPAPKTVSRIIPRSRRAFDKPNAVKTQNIGIYRI